MNKRYYRSFLCIFLCAVFIFAGGLLFSGCGNPSTETPQDKDGGQTGDGGDKDGDKDDDDDDDDDETEKDDYADNGTTTTAEGLLITIYNGTATVIGYLGGAVSVVIPKTHNGRAVTDIGENAFRDNAEITAVTLPDGLINIGDNAFDSSGLTEINIPDSVINIGDYAFYGCLGLTEISMPDGVKSIGAGAFCNSTGLTTVNIPDSVTEIGDYAFSGCLGLTVSRIPEKITIINKGTFENCTALTSLYIPKGLQTISRYALNGCSALTVIFYGGTDNSMWQSISVGASNSLLHTRTYYYSEIRRADGGYYWHYIDGVPTVW